MQVAIVEDNYFVWEKLSNSGALGPQGSQLLAHMLSSWESYADMYASALNRLGHRVTRVVPSANIREPDDTLHRLGHTVRRIPVVGGSPAIQGLSFGLNLVKDLKRHPSQIFHFLSLYSRFTALSAPFLSRFRPVIAQYSGGEPSIGEGALGAIKIRMSLGIALRSCDAVLIDEPLGPELAYQVWSLTKYYGVSNSKLVNFPVVCVDTSLFSPKPKHEARRSLGLPPDKMILLCPTSIAKPPVSSYMKDPFRVVDLVAHLPDHAKREVLVCIAGSGAGFQDLRAKIQKECVNDNVKLVGLVPHWSLPDYFNACDAVVLPFLCRDLTLGTTVVESYSCDRPAIGFRRDSTIQANQSGGFLIDPDPSRGARELVDLLVELPNFKIGPEARALVMRYSLDHVSRRLAEVYQTLLGPGRGAQDLS